MWRKPLQEAQAPREAGGAGDYGFDARVEPPLLASSSPSSSSDRSAPPDSIPFLAPVPPSPSCCCPLYHSTSLAPTHAFSSLSLLSPSASPRSRLPYLQCPPSLRFARSRQRVEFTGFATTVWPPTKGARALPCSPPASSTRPTPPPPPRCASAPRASTGTRASASGAPALPARSLQCLLLRAPRTTGRPRARPSGTLTLRAWLRVKAALSA